MGAEPGETESIRLAADFLLHAQPKKTMEGLNCNQGFPTGSRAGSGRLHYESSESGF